MTATSTAASAVMTEATPRARRACEDRRMTLELSAAGAIGPVGAIGSNVGAGAIASKACVCEGGGVASGNTSGACCEE